MSLLAVLGPGGPALVDPATPLLRADDLGVVRGESVFETVRVVDGHPVLLDRHLARLGRSAARVEVELPQGLAGLVGCCCAAWTAPDGALRLIVTKGSASEPGVAFAQLAEVPYDTVRGREHGVRAVTLVGAGSVVARAAAPWLLGGVKSTSYAANMAALREARARGADDVVLVSEDGEVLEGPTSTAAWVAGGVLVTPPPDEVAILPGTTIEAVLGLAEAAGVPARVRRGSVAELREADEVLLASSVRGVAPVVALDGRALPVGPVTALLRDALERAAHSR